MRSRTNGGLVQTFSTDALNQLNTIGRATTNLTVSGSLTHRAANILVNGQPATAYPDNTFARPNVGLTNGTNQFTTTAQYFYGVGLTNTVSVNLPETVSLADNLNGNLTEDGLRHFEYDQENQLTKVYVRT